MFAKTKPLIYWVVFICLSAILTGSLSAFFITVLNEVTLFREHHIWIIAGLPLAGIVIILAYQKIDSSSAKGNNLILMEYDDPKGRISWLMSPLVLLTTLLTHLFGGSAGREGVAVQYGAVTADQLAKKLKFDAHSHRLAVQSGIAAGFASLFATPLAGAIFALEIVQSKRIGGLPILLCLSTAYLSYAVCNLWHVPHTIYPSIVVTEYFTMDLLWMVLVGICSGLACRLFIFSSAVFDKLGNQVKNSYYRIVAGSLLILFIIYLLGTTKYIGLGLPTILNSFEQYQRGYDFLFKIVLTTLTLSIGFKGGEVTPLFFIGATLASAMTFYVPASLPLMAAAGMISVFAAATKTPFASSVMAVELFGLQILPYAAIAALIAYVVSGRKGIYGSQRQPILLSALTPYTKSGIDQ